VGSRLAEPVRSTELDPSAATTATQRWTRWHPMTPAELEQLGLGLEYGTVRHAPARPEWHTAALALIDELHEALGAAAIEIEHIGSTAIADLLAKPIVDIAIRLAPDAPLEGLIDTLGALGYLYRGDAGTDGGLVFVLDVRPWVRVAHVHGIRDGDPQWDRYLAVVAALRSDPAARRAYETTKRELAASHPDGRQAYTAGKSAVVADLLAEHEHEHLRGT
jgi:GrpB-like predicted nucleotidyltransferase (UPF0157 family)